MHGLRPVVPWGAGGAMAPPNFGRSVNPISTKEGSLFPLNNTGTPGFSDLPTALGLRTPNQGINQRYLRNWAEVADKICFSRT
jgi:hypothetical protein